MTTPAKVYFIKDLKAENIVKIYEKLGKKLAEPVAVKVHTGEKGNQNFLRPEYFKPMVDKLGDAKICECNTAYDGERNTTEKHKGLLEFHGWSTTFPDRCDILDEYQNPEQDLHLPINDGYKLKMNYVGQHLENYNSLLVLCHFKAHGLGVN